jgi:hypothetical protein
MPSTCLPNDLYFRQARINPKHVKKICHIEDIVSRNKSFATDQPLQPLAAPDMSSQPYDSSYCSYQHHKKSLGYQLAKAPVRAAQSMKLKPHLGRGDNSSENPILNETHTLSKAMKISELGEEPSILLQRGNKDARQGGAGDGKKGAGTVQAKGRHAQRGNSIELELNMKLRTSISLASAGSNAEVSFQD